VGNISKKQEASIKLIKQAQNTFSTKDGEAVLQYLLKDLGFFTSTYSENTHVMSYNEGRRSVAIQLIKMMRTDLDKVKLMLDQIEKEEIFNAY
jgi:hypothetical protein